MSNSTERPAAPRTAPRVDPAAVAKMVTELDALPESEFTRALRENLIDEDPVETAAFRSPELVERSFAAIKFLLTSTQSRVQRRPGEQPQEWGRRRRQAELFIARAGQERRLLELVRDGLRAQRGIIAAAPNPRARAARELQRNHPQEYLALVRKHERAIVEERRAKRAEWKAQQGKKK